MYGNNDRNETGLIDVAQKNNFMFQDPPRLLVLNNKKIAIFHEPDFINDFLDVNQDIDIVLHGHTHRFRYETIDKILFFNPGESAGMVKGSNAIGVLNLDKMEIKRIFF